ncbi:MAG: hypothetical protein K5860_02435 [Bacteroidales bacterium]|nr:hypothetical protein [Bacteroidales bacterium]
MTESICKWHFAECEETAGIQGPNNAMSQTFAKFPSRALVRESIQNSLDARRKDNENPVIVCFEYRTFEKIVDPTYKYFFDLSKHMDACRSQYSNDNKATKSYSAMIRCLATGKIGFIRVSDFNTEGMPYSGDNSPFEAFVRSVGVSVKESDTAGGSFGFGKGAFFVMSPINTLLVSTRTTNGDCFFEGVSRLCSHRLDGKRRDHMGFFDCNEGKPVDDENKIPGQFKRNESGTTIGIMGVDNDNWNNAKDEIVKEVLRNFFVAVKRRHLVVMVDCSPNKGNNGVVIDDTTIENLMSLYFPTTNEKRGSNEDYNPRPYYEAFVDGKLYENSFPHLGDVEFYVKEFEDNSTQILYMRQLLMTVYRKGQNLGNYNGVFICENETGNKILRDMEDSEHKEWSAEFCTSEKDTSKDKAQNALKEIKKFIEDCLDDFMGVDAEGAVDVADLQKYLSAYDNAGGKGDKGNPFYGQATGNTIKEGASKTTEGQLEEKKEKSVRKKGKVLEIKTEAFKKLTGGTQKGGIGGSNYGTGGTAPGAGNHFVDGEPSGMPGHYKREIEVEWRPVISVRKGFMDIVIYTEEDVVNAELDFVIGKETNIKDDVVIISSNKGKVDGMTIKEVPLKSFQKNIIQIQFSDKMSHSLNLGAYEVK